MSKLIVILFLATTSAYAGLSKIDALGMIESGNNDAAIGSFGEVSRFQIKPHIWREYTSSRSWRDARIAAVVARDYIADLEAGFRKRARREPTDFDVYVLWNAGPAYYSRVGFAPSRVHSIIRERAGRYANLRSLPTSAADVPAPAVAQAAAPPPLPPGRPFTQLLAAPLPVAGSKSLAPAISGMVLPSIEPLANSSSLSAVGLGAR